MITQDLPVSRTRDIGIPVRVSPFGSGRFSLLPSDGEYPCYDDYSYSGLALPSSRNRAYREALVKLAAGKTVLDIGTGRDALWAMAAVEEGARRAYGIERLEASSTDAVQTVRQAGLADAVKVIHGDSREVSLPEKPELCVSEIIGSIASSEGVIAYLNDARRRLCGNDCSWIPYRCETVIAAACMPESLFPGGYSFAEESIFRIGQIFAYAHYPFDLRICVAGPAHEAIVSTNAVVEDLIFGDYLEENQICDVTLTIKHDDTRLTGFFLWARVQCLPGGPVIDGMRPSDTPSWAPIYVPASGTGIPCNSGDRIEIRFVRRLSDDHIHPDYLVQAVARPRHSSPQAIIWQSDHHGRQFRASSFYRRLFPSPRS